MVSWESFLNFWQHINVMNDVDNVQYTLLKQGLWMKELLGKDLPRNRKNDGCIPFECCWNSMNKGDLLWECEAMWGWQATVACLEACWRLLSGWVPPTLRLTPTPRGKKKPKSISNSFNNCLGQFVVFAIKQTYQKSAYKQNHFAFTSYWVVTSKSIFKKTKNR